MSRKTALIFLSLLAVFSISCSSRPGEYGEFYKSLTGNVSPKDVDWLEDPPSIPELISGGKESQDRERMQQDGYVLLGYSSFNAKSVNQERAKFQGQKVGAGRVLVYSQYAYTDSDVAAIPGYTPGQQSTTYTQGKIIGPGGNTSVSGVSTSYSSGQYYTSYFPYTYSRFDFLATYWVKRRYQVLGVIVNELPSSVQANIKRNSGILVTVVVKGSPAFQADIVPGDVIVGISGEKVDNVEDFHSVLARHAGEKSDIDMIRDKVATKISVQLNKKLPPKEKIIDVEKGKQ